MTLGDRLLMVRNLDNFAEAHRAAGDARAAAQCYGEAIDICRELDSPGMLAIVACNFARLLITQGQSESARAHLQESLVVARAHANFGMNHHLLEVSAGLAAVRDVPLRAARLNGAAASRLHETGARREPVDAAFIDPLIAWSRAAAGEPGFDDAEQAGRALRRDAAMTELESWLATPA